MDTAYSDYKSLPKISLPAESQIPTWSNECEGSDNCQQMMLSVVSTIMKEVLHTKLAISQHMYHVDIVESQRKLAEMVACIQPIIHPLISTNLTPSIVSAPEAEVPGSGIYDDYFKVTRTQITLPHLLAETVSIVLNVLVDLQLATIERDEIVAIMQGIHDLLGIYQRILQEACDTELFAIPPEQTASIVPSRFSPDYQNVDELSLYRWVVGHHLFFILTIGCCTALMRASQAIDAANEQRAAAELYCAASLLRATTAAMWYGGNFSADTYRGFIRDTMRAAGAPGGFSGHQSADYVRMLEAISSVKAASHRRYGRDLKQYPKSLHESLAHFFATYVVDAEHHVLIAIAKVGAAPPLTHEDFVVSAADLLRDLVQQRTEVWLEWGKDFLA